MSSSGQQAADGVKIHLLDAVSTQRESVLNTFDSQRDAIIKAVDEQRQAAMAPLQSQQARQAGGRVNGPQPQPAAPSRQQAVAADIVLTLKALVAEEVRTQLIALLAAAEAKQKAAAPPPLPAG